MKINKKEEVQEMKKWLLRGDYALISARSKYSMDHIRSVMCGRVNPPLYVYLSIKELAEKRKMEFESRKNVGIRINGLKD